MFKKNADKHHQLQMANISCHLSKSKRLVNVNVIGVYVRQFEAAALCCRSLYYDCMARIFTHTQARTCIDIVNTLCIIDCGGSNVFERTKIGNEPNKQQRYVQKSFYSPIVATVRCSQIKHQK